MFSPPQNWAGALHIEALTCRLITRCERRKGNLVLHRVNAETRCGYERGQVSPSARALVLALLVLTLVVPHGGRHGETPRLRQFHLL